MAASKTTRPVESTPGENPLQNPRHEHFALFISQGIPRFQAFVKAGFSKNNAAPNALRLLKRENVRLRIEHLQKKVEERVVEQSVVDRKWVIDLLKRNALAAFEEKDRSATNRAAELLGKDLGMFIDRHDHNLKWDGDLSKLDAPQLQNLMFSLEAKIGDPAVIAATKELAASEMVQ